MPPNVSNILQPFFIDQFEKIKSAFYYKLKVHIGETGCIQYFNLWYDESENTFKNLWSTLVDKFGCGNEFSLHFYTHNLRLVDLNNDESLKFAFMVHDIGEETMNTENIIPVILNFQEPEHLRFVCDNIMKRLVIDDEEFEAPTKCKLRIRIKTTMSRERRIKGKQYLLIPDGRTYSRRAFEDSESGGKLRSIMVPAMTDGFHNGIKYEPVVDEEEEDSYEAENEKNYEKKRAIDKYNEMRLLNSDSNDLRSSQRTSELSFFELFSREDVRERIALAALEKVGLFAEEGDVQQRVHKKKHKKK